MWYIITMECYSTLKETCYYMDEPQKPVKQKMPNSKDYAFYNSIYMVSREGKPIQTKQISAFLGLWLEWVLAVNKHKGSLQGDDVIVNSVCPLDWTRDAQIAN